MRGGVLLFTERDNCILEASYHKNDIVLSFLFCSVCLRLMLPGSLDCPFYIAPSVISNIYICHIGVAINALLHIAEGSMHIVTGTPLLTMRSGHEGLCATRMCNTNQKYQMNDIYTKKKVKHHLIY